MKLSVILSLIAVMNLTASVYSKDISSLQGVTVTGKVTDQSGTPLVGVSVLEKGTTNGAVSNVDGLYSITVSSTEAILVFSYISYLSEEIPVGNQTSINLSMVEDLTEVDEVVVIGYGTQRKEAVTGSVASMGGSDMREVPSANITQALQGRIPGVQMSQTSSKPGAQMQIRIRGTRSLGPSELNDPLIVLDGIPFAGTIGDISTNDIKSIDILKDASATAIYGSRGANGVILITTNKGTKGQKALVTYSGYYGMKKAIPVPMMESQDFLKLRILADRYTAAGPDEDTTGATNTDWQDLFYRTGIVTSHEIGISGGTEQGSYNAGVGYYLDQAVIPTQQYKRFKARVALEQEIGKYVKIGLTSNSNYNLLEGDQVGMYGILSLTPIAEPYDSTGAYKRAIRMPLDNSWIYPRDVLNDVSDIWLSETRSYATYNNAYGEVDIPGIEGLKFRVNLGMTLQTINKGTFTGYGINSYDVSNPSSASVQNELKAQWAVENLLTYNRSFGKSVVNLVGLYSAEEIKYNKTYISARNIDDEFQFYNLGGGDISVDPLQQDYYKSGLVSYMGRAIYTFDNRYMLTATIRSDASSRLAPGYKRHTYPAVSVGWNLGNETFIKNISAISSLKVRLGYGQTSNQAVAPYSTLGRLTTVPYNFGQNGYATGAYVSDIANPQLGWEYSETMNYGLDFGFMQNRLSGTIEHYETNTKDILLDVNLPTTAGVASVTKNIGESQNKGWEISLDGLILDRPNGLQWEAGVNLYANKNKLVALASGQEEDIANGWFVGHPINSIYDYEKIGLWQEEDVELLNQLEPGASNIPGMIRVKYVGGFNEDGTPVRRIGSDDRQILSVDPKFLGGFNTRVSYKGIDLSVVGAFQQGGILISTLYGSNGYLNMLTGRRNNVKVDYWTPDNTGAEFPNPAGPISGDNPKYGSTMGYFDGSYLKIRTITLGYTFSQKTIQSFGIQNFHIYLTAQNPFVMFSPYHKLSGLDPETNSYGDENQASSGYQHRILVVGTNTPSTRNFIFGINATF